MAAASADSSAKALKRLTRDWSNIEKKPVSGARFELAKTASGEEDWFHWIVHIEAPAEYIVNDETRPSPFAGHTFTVNFLFPASYPFKPPVLEFEKNVLYHPNVDLKSGEVCGDLLAAIGPTKRVPDIVGLVQSFLAQPNMEHPLDADIAAQMQKDIAAFEREAQRHLR